MCRWPLWSLSSLLQCITCSNEMTWRYRNLLQLLQRKRNEMEQLSNEFESRVRTKEVCSPSHSPRTAHHYPSPGGAAPAEATAGYTGHIAQHGGPQETPSRPWQCCTREQLINETNKGDYKISCTCIISPSSSSSSSFPLCCRILTPELTSYKHMREQGRFMAWSMKRHSGN